jgi:uncharacterized OB-fold protein
MRCAKCGAENLEGRRFCTQCGSPLAAKCLQRGAATQPGEKFCGECGAALGTAPAAAGKSDEPRIRIGGPRLPFFLFAALVSDIQGELKMNACIICGRKVHPQRIGSDACDTKSPE